MSSVQSSPESTIRTLARILGGIDRPAWGLVFPSSFQNLAVSTLNAVDRLSEAKLHICMAKMERKKERR